MPTGGALFQGAGHFLKSNPPKRGIHLKIAILCGALTGWTHMGWKLIGGAHFRGNGFIRENTVHISRI